MRSGRSQLVVLPRLSSRAHELEALLVENKLEIDYYLCLCLCYCSVVLLYCAEKLLAIVDEIERNLRHGGELRRSPASFSSVHIRESLKGRANDWNRLRNAFSTAQSRISLLDLGISNIPAKIRMSSETPEAPPVNTRSFYVDLEYDYINGTLAAHKCVNSPALCGEPGASWKFGVYRSEVAGEEDASAMQGLRWFGPTGLDKIAG